MTDPSLIADLIRAGVDPELVARVSNALVAEAEFHGIPSESRVDKIRAKDRERKRPKGGIPSESTGIPWKAESTPLTISKKDTIEEERKVSKKEIKKERGSRISMEWSPSGSDTDFASSKGMPHDRIRLEAEKFRNYWIAKSGAAATKLDWSATWRNWVLSSLERTPGNPVSTGPPNGQPAYLTPPPGMESLEESRRKYGGTYAEAIGANIRIDAGRDETRPGESEKLQPPGRSALRVA